MNIPEKLNEYLVRERKIWFGKMKWVGAEYISTLSHYIVYGDMRADWFLKVAKDFDELKSILLDHLDGDTGCLFETSIFIIVSDGKEVKVRDFIK